MGSNGRESMLHELLRDFPGMADMLTGIAKRSGNEAALERLEQEFSEGTEEEISARIKEEREGIVAWAVRCLG